MLLRHRPGGGEPGRRAGPGRLGGRSWRALERGEAQVTDFLAEGRSAGDVAAFFEERLFDVLHQLLRLDRGTFEFVPEVRPRISTGHRVPVERALEEARVRLEEWKEIEAVIPGMHVRLGMRLRLEPEREEVTLSADEWGALAGLQAGASVTELAQRLGHTEFQAAKVVAELVRRGLVVAVHQPVPAEEPAVGGPERSAGDFGLIDVQTEEEAPGRETASGVPAASSRDGQDEDEAGFLRAALSEVVRPGRSEEEQEDDQDEAGTPVMRRRGLGAIAREWRSDS